MRENIEERANKLLTLESVRNLMTQLKNLSDATVYANVFLEKRCCDLYAKSIGYTGITTGTDFKI